MLRNVKKTYVDNDQTNKYNGIEEGRGGQGISYKLQQYYWLNENALRTKNTAGIKLVLVDGSENETIEFLYELTK